MMMNTKKRQYLKALAHELSPVVRIGKGGVSEAVVKEAGVALEAHELIKVRIDADGPPQRKTFAAELATATAAELVNVIGKIAIVYRQRKEDPKIKLPS